MKTMKKVTAMLLVLLTIANLFANIDFSKFFVLEAFAEELTEFDDEIQNGGDTFGHWIDGEIGETMSWSLDVSSGVMTIWGNGMINEEAWRTTRQVNPARIKELVIEEGVSGIGCVFTEYYTNLKRVSIPSSAIGNIDENAFCGDDIKLDYISVAPEYETGVAWSYNFTNKTLNISKAAEGSGVIDGERFWHHINCVDFPSIEHAVIGEGITNIGFNVFWYHLALESIELPSTVYLIDSSNFADVPSLKEVNVAPENETFYTVDGALYGYARNDEGEFYIDWGEVWGFENEPDLSTYVPDITNETEPFYAHIDDNGYTRYGYVAGANGTFFVSDEEGVVSAYLGYYEEEDWHSHIIYYPRYTRKLYFVPRDFSGSFKILPGTYVVEGFACSDCKGITEVHISYNVEEINGSAFQYSSNITNIVCANPEAYSFDSEHYVLYKEYDHYDEEGNYLGNAMNLVVATPAISGHYIIPDTYDFVFINDNAFNGCINLTEITVPDNVQGLGSGTFRNCTALKTINLPDDVSEIAARYATENEEDRWWFYLGYEGFVNSGLTSIDIPYGVDDIPEFCFADCSDLVSVNIPDTVKKAEWLAFRNCTSLETIVLPDSINDPYCNIDWWGLELFSGCTALKNVKLPNNENFDTIGANFFAGCTSLETINIPDNIKHIDPCAFINSGITSINTNQVETIGWNAFDNCANLTTVELPNVTEIGGCAFANCPALSEVILAEGLSEIADHTFVNSSSLTNINIPSSVRSIGYAAFCNSGFNTEITIPEGVEFLGEYAFCDCNYMPSISLPSTLTEISNWAICSCDRLAEIKVNENNPNYCSVDGILFSKNMTTLYNYPCLKAGAYVVPNTVTEIGVSAFDSCSALTGLTLPDGLTSVEELGFAYCYSMTNMTIPASMEYIGPAAFMECWALRDVYYYGEDWNKVTVDDTHAKEWDGTYNWQNYNNDAFHKYSTIHYQIGADKESGYDAKLSKELTLSNNAKATDVTLNVESAEANTEFVTEEANLDAGSVYNSDTTWLGYDIHLVDGNQNVVSVEEGTATVRVPFPEGVTADNYSDYAMAVYHQTNGTVERLEAIPDEYGLVFTTNSFSPFAISVQKNQDIGFSTEVAFDSENHETLSAGYRVNDIDDVLYYGVALLDEGYYSSYKAVSPMNFIDNRNSMIFTTANETLVYDSEAKQYKANVSATEGFNASANYYYLSFAKLANGQYVVSDNINYYDNNALGKIDVLDVGNISFDSENIPDIEINLPENIYLEPGDVYQLDVTSMAGEDITYTTESDNVLVTADGRVLAVNAETTDIVIISDGTKTERISIEIGGDINKKYVINFVCDLYNVVLGRAAEAEGAIYWNDLLIGKLTTGADAAYGFFFSDEYIAQDKSDEEFINDLYRVFMRRDADQSGYDYWASVLAQGASRVDVFYGFINAPEWVSVCYEYNIAPGGNAPTPPSTEGVYAFAERLYTTCLGREADPDGLEYWAQLLLNKETTGSTAAYCFFFSDEFINSNHSDEEYVTRLYRTFMGREPGSAEELNYWCDAMQAGATRKDVFDGFANSPEFEAICASYGIIR